MTTGQMRFFIRVVECGSFSRAEESCFCTAQGIRKQMDSLEQELGVVLLNRSPRGISLTTAGRIFFDRAAAVLKQIDDMVEEVRAAEVQTLRVESPPHPLLLLGDVLTEFTRRHPQVKLSCSFWKERAGRGARLLSGEVDVAECIFRPESMLEGLGFVPIRRLGHVALMSEQHPFAGRTNIRIGDLEDCDVSMSYASHRMLGPALPAGCRVEVLEHDDIFTIFSRCFQNSLYLTKAFFAQNLPPLISLPLEEEFSEVAGVLYREPPSPVVRDFLKLVWEMYPAVD